MKKLGILIATISFSIATLAQNLKINELMASNNTTVMDNFFEYNDWIEIYNAGGIVNLAGYYLSDDPLNLTKFQIPSTNAGVTTILPNGYLIFWADKDNATQGENHTNFTLSSNGESVILTMPDGVTIVDQIDFPQQAPDISYGRSCDGCGSLQYFNNPTYDASNFETAAQAELLFINEVQAENTGVYHDPQFQFDPWVEIYNPNNYQVNVGGYYLSNNGTATQWQIPTTEPFNTVIPANGFRVFWCDNDLADGATHTSLSLSNTGGTVKLYGPNGTSQVDALTYSPIAAGTSAGRSSDGANSIVTFTQPTPINSNTLFIIQPEGIVINEVMSKNLVTITDNAGELEDWVELYNPLDHDVNLAGYFMSDDSENPRRWMIPATFADSVTIQSHGWLLFWADGDLTQGVRHAKFSLNNNQEFVGLYSPDGLSRADEIAWDHMGADTSLGRITDGASQWINFIVTTPDASNNQGTINVLESETTSAFGVYPNPTRCLVNLSRRSTIQIYSIEGRFIASQRNALQVSFADYPNGIYLIKDEFGNVARVVKE